MIRIAPKDCKDKGDIQLDGTTDVTVLARELSKNGVDFVILGGTINLNGGHDAKGTRYIEIGANTKVTGSPDTVLVASTEPCRWNVRKEGARLSSLRFVGFVQIQNYSSNFTCVDVTVEHTFDGKTWINWKGKGGCTGAIQNWVAPGKTMKNVTYKNCTITFSWHHGMGFHIAGAQQGSWWEDILVENCNFISCGSGISGNDSAGTQDWSTGLDIDTGSIRRVKIKGCYFYDCFQSGGHTDGHWLGATPHEQHQIDLVFEDCVAELCGVRAMNAKKQPTELYCNGFYVQEATMIRCHTEGCAKAGIHAKAGSGQSALKVIDCSDEGSAYSLVVEYGPKNVEVSNYTSSNAKLRAVQTSAILSKFINVTILNYNGLWKPILLGKTERLEYIGALSHASQLAKYEALGYDMRGDAFDFAFDKPMKLEDAIEFYPKSVFTKPNIALRLVEPVSPVIPPIDPPVIPVPIPAARVKSITLEYTDGSKQVVELPNT